jgi:hypothetical protein
MRPGQTTPDELEVAWLEHFITEYPNVRVDIPALRVLTRSYTCVGCYTEFIPRQKLLTGERQTLQLSSTFALMPPVLPHESGV